jgi:hypothetical protein
MSAMPKSGNIVVARKPRRSPKPLPPRKTPPACGPLVRVIRGKAVERQAEDPASDERARDGLERLLEESRRAARGE